MLKIICYCSKKLNIKFHCCKTYWKPLGKFEMKKYLCVYILSELYNFYAFTSVEKHNDYQNKIEFWIT